MKHNYKQLKWETRDEMNTTNWIGDELISDELNATNWRRRIERRRIDIAPIPLEDLTKNWLHRRKA